MRALKQAVKQVVRQCGYSIRSLGNASAVTAVDLAADISVHCGKPRSPLLFDVGGNEGQTIEDMLREFPHASVVSFEPSPKSFARLTERFGRSRNVKLEHGAVGDCEGELPFTVFSQWSVNDSLLSPKWTAPASTVQVPVTTIDRYCSENDVTHVDWLKIDTQGYDLRVLQGAKGMLQARRIRAVSAEAMFIPMYEGQPDLSDLLSFMREMRYVLAGFYEQEFKSNALSHCNVLWLANQPV